MKKSKSENQKTSRLADVTKVNFCITSNEQQKRLLAALQKNPMTTLQARHELDVLHPAGRVQELREQGLNIITHWTTEETAKGKHRVARYVLLAGKWKGRAAA